MLSNGKDNSTRHPLILGLCALGLVLILAGAFFALQRSRKQMTAAVEIADRLDAICAREGLTSGRAQTLDSRAFAAWLGGKLFGNTDSMTGWNRLDTVPLAKAEGLRAGDILCTPGHAAVIYSVGETGEIRTIECEDSGERRVTVGGFYLNDPENTDLQCIADRCGFECLLTSPENKSPALWSGRMAALPEEPAITDATWPTVLSNGQFFGLRGTVSCRYTLTEIRATVTNRVTGAVIFNVAVAPDGNTYSIGNPVTEPINDGLVFNSPECANSWLNYRLTVRYDRNGTAMSAVLIDQDFRVGTPVTEEPDK